jgi:hypothetical protein
VSRSGTRCRWAAGEACRAEVGRGRQLLGAACMRPGGVGEEANRHIAAAAAGHIAAVAGIARRWGLGGRRGVEDGRLRRAIVGIAAWVL